jgi:hypothetical protein
MRSASLTVALIATVPAMAHAQASFVYRLGKDTVAVEQYTRTANRLTGEVASRQGAVVVRTTYDAALGANGRITSLTYKVLGSDDKPIRGRISEVRYTAKGDSVERVVVWADSTQTRMFGAVNAVPFSAPSYGMLELAVLALRKGATPTAVIPMLGPGPQAALPNVTLIAGAGDTVRLANGFVLRADREGRIQSVDGSGTTQKLLATRGAGGLNVAAIAAKMTPTGALSARGTVRGHFQTQQPGGVMLVDYGRPLVRERTVWGGLLIPLDTIWRLGANEATHFATGRDVTFGDITVPAGLYTLWLYNAKSGPQLVVNKGTGQWGTAYDQTKDLVRIPLTMSATPEHVEEFTINIKQSAPSRGTLEFAWGSQMASAGFVVK